MRWKLILTIMTVGLLLNVPLTYAEPSAGPALETSQPEMKALDRMVYVPGELLVKFVDSLSPSQMGSVRQSIGAQNIETFSSIGVQHWRLGRGISVSQAINRLSLPVFEGIIEYAEPNYIVFATDFPNDPMKGDLWGLHNIGQTEGTYDADIDAPEAWSVQTGSSTIVVGVIDSGIDLEHEDLSANLWVNPGEIPDNGIDDDANGYVDDVNGWDFFNGDNDPFDDCGHGTHVSGTIGAVGDNGIGVVGVNWDVQIMPLKFMGSGCGGPISAGVAAINYAASFEDGSGNKIVRITSNSYGGSKKSRTEEQAIANSGALFVAAAGNSGSSRKGFPAGYSLDNIISVAATDHDDQLASFSNYGTTWVDLAAPGVDILSTYPGNEYTSMDGTSMSTPHVAGVAGLILADDPTLSIASLKARILDNVDQLPSLEGKVLTGGRLNAQACLGAPDLPADSDPPSAVTDLSSTGQTMFSITLSWTATGDDGDVGTAYLYDVRYHSETITEENWNAAIRVDGEPGPQASGTTEVFEVTGLSSDTTYYFALKVVDEVGNWSPLSNVVSATTEASAWDIDTVDSGEDLGRDVSMAYDPQGNPAIAYTDDANSLVKFAHWNGASWDIEVLEQGYEVKLAYDPTDGYPSLTYRWEGELKLAHWNGASWDIEVVVQKGAFGPSLAYDPDTQVPTMAFCHEEGKGKNKQRNLKFAVYNPVTQSWDMEIVESDISSRVSLAYDLNGDPAIVYTDDVDDDGSRDTFKYAHWNGASWDIDIILTVTTGQIGHSPTLEFSPTTGYPATIHTFCGGVRFSSWNGASWDTELIWEVQACPASAFSHSPSGIPYASFIFGDNQYGAQKIGSEWEYEIIEDGPGGSQRFSLKFTPNGNPSVSYANGPYMRYAVKP